MLEILQFVFSGFWVAVGSLMLVSVIGVAVARVVGAGAAAVAAVVMAFRKR